MGCPGRFRRLEVPTWLVAATIYGGWLTVTWAASSLPWWGTGALGGFLVAWHGSLQHETIHGHPTRSRRANALLAGLPLGLWLPYGLYRELHLAHHRCPRLTDPLEDPESFYLGGDAWRAAGPIARAFHRAHATLVGRLVLGPPYAALRLYAAELRRLLRGDRAHLRHWLAHALGLGLVLAWALGVAGLSLASYLLLFVYPGLSLTLLRSFAEHRADARGGGRTAVVEAGRVFSLLFLHNNLHAVHHERPGLPWFELPRAYRESRDRILAADRSYHLAGYGAIARRYALRPQAPPWHPAAREEDGQRAAS